MLEDFTMSYTKVSRSFSDMEDEWLSTATKWECKIIREDGRVFSTKYYMGSALTDDPTLLEVLGSCVHGARTVRESGSFREWCENLGYNLKERESYTAYCDYAKVNDLLGEFLTNDEFDAIAEAFDNL